MNQLQKEILYSDSTLNIINNLLDKNSEQEENEIYKILDHVLPAIIPQKDKDYIFNEIFIMMNSAKIDSFYQGVEFAMKLFKL